MPAVEKLRSAMTTLLMVPTGMAWAGFQSQGSPARRALLSPQLT